jgi:hypothetical protein
MRPMAARISALAGAAPETCQPDRLCFQLGAGERVFRIALRHVHAGGVRPAVGRAHLDLADPPLRVRRLDVVVVDHPHPLAERGDPGVRQGQFLELARARRAVHRDQPQHRPHRELRLVNRMRMDDGAEHVDGGLVHPRRHLGDLVMPELFAPDDF